MGVYGDRVVDRILEGMLEDLECQGAQATVNKHGKPSRVRKQGKDIIQVVLLGHGR